MTPSCRQTLVTQLEGRFRKRKAELLEKLKQIDCVCTTADCWTSRRRGFLGITVHWIEAVSLERRGCCLAIREIKGPHTYDVLAKLMQSVNEEFELKDKICYTVTDSGSNFLKAFKHFSMYPQDSREQTSLSPEEENDDEDESSSGIIEFHDLNDLLHHPTIFNDSYENDIIYNLPPHWKCACHLLNLVAVNSLAKTKSNTDTDGILHKVSVQTFSKLTAVWNKQNRSVTACEKIKNAIGSFLVTPVDTRWNSMYDAVSKVNDILCAPEMDTKFDKLCDNLDIKRLQPIHKKFVSEYVRVLQPICSAIDILQGDREVGLGHLVPTLLVVKTQLRGLLETTGNDQLTLCIPIIHCLLNDIESRFAKMCASDDSQLAAVVNPKFKLDWVECDTHKATLTMLLKRRANSVSIRELSTVKTSTTEQKSCTSPSSATAKSFFATLAAKRKSEGAGNKVDEEVMQYLSDSSTDLSSLSLYPRIRKLYISLNTGLPASAAVERLFSLGGRVFSPLRSKLSSDHFEMMVFLRAAKW